MPPDELRDAARFKVKRHLPFPVDEAYLEVSPPASFEDENAPALVVAVRKEVVDSRAEAIARAGLMPLRAELEAQAILRIVERSLNSRSVLWRDASLTIIDVGGTNTHMYVVQNQRLQFIRGVSFGADMFGKAVAQCLDIPNETAFALLGDPVTTLTSEGIATLNHDGRLWEIDLSRELEKLTREFLRLLRYFRSLHPERSYAGILDHMVVCGGIAGLVGLDHYLSLRLGLRVERARPIAGMAARFDRGAFESISGRQEAFTVAIGLALSGLQKWMGRRESDANSEFSWKRSA
jgi:type IV pilus assembly protein PilM